MNEYVPQPIDTRGIELPADIVPLTERLARNIHEVWAQRRVSEGWTYGEQRDDTARRHPGLVPYEQLTDSEREYDRRTALETLRTIVSLGFRIDSPSAVAGPQTAQAAARLMSSGEPLQALDVLEQLRRLDRADVRVAQLLALALLRCGDVDRAQQVLVDLHRTGHDDEETLGLLARVWKEHAERSRDTAERARLLRMAGDIYRQAFERTRGMWTGINAATIAWRLGAQDQAHALAWAVRERCLVDRGPDRYWAEATLGEAALLLGDFPEAARRYAAAAQEARAHRRFADLASTARQARLLLTCGVDAPAAAEAVATLRMPGVAVWLAEWPAAGDDRALHSSVGENERSIKPIAGDNDQSIDPIAVESLAATLRESEVAFACAALLQVADRIFVEAAHAVGAEVETIVLGDAVPSVDATVRLPCSGNAALDARYARLVQIGFAGLRAARLGAPLVRLGPSAQTLDAQDMCGILRVDSVRVADVDLATRLLAAVDTLSRAADVPPARVQTGYGLTLVFAATISAARFALALSSQVTGVRQLLHAGPLEVLDGTSWGVHLAHVARMEADTPPDHVYATLPCAALLAALEVEDMACDYVGRTAGGEALYHVRSMSNF